MFLDHDDHFQYLFDRVDENPKHTFIASYGIYAGISYAGQDVTTWGPKYQSTTRDLMEKMRSLPNVKFLIGTSNYRSCKGTMACVDCEKQYCRSLIRLVNHAELFPEFEWRVTNDLYLKAYLFFYDKEVKGISGGKNFSDSSWVDCSFELETKNIKKLYAHVKGIWGESKPLSDEGVAEIFEEQEISERGLQATVSGIIGSPRISADEDPPF